MKLATETLERAIDELCKKYALLDEQFIRCSLIIDYEELKKDWMSIRFDIIQLEKAIRILNGYNTEKEEERF